MQKIMLNYSGKCYKKTPTDYVIATGKSYSVKDFINFCCKYLKFKIIWKGKGLNTKCFLIKSDGSKELLIKIDKKYYRPVDIDYLKGDPSKALKELKFKLRYDIQDLVKDMIDSDIKSLKPKFLMKKICNFYCWTQRPGRKRCA